MSQQNTIGKHQTRVTQLNDLTKITYHQTDVVRFTPQTITLDSGGWHTPTTKLRMNQSSNQYGLGYQVYQRDHTWYINFKNETMQYRDLITLTR